MLPIFNGGSCVILSLSFFDLFFCITAACDFQSLCSSCTDAVMSPCSMAAFLGFRLFHSELESSLPKWSRNGKYPFAALGNVLWKWAVICFALCHWISLFPYMVFFMVCLRKMLMFSILLFPWGSWNWTGHEGQYFVGFLQSSLIKLVLLYKRTFSVPPNGKYTL